MNVYDFDLGIIYHTTNASGGGIATTYFNDIAVDGVLPQHIENVKQVGCDLAEGYIEREQSDEYSFTTRRCNVFLSKSLFVSFRIKTMCHTLLILIFIPV